MVREAEHEQLEESKRQYCARHGREQACEVGVDAEVIQGLEDQHAEKVNDKVAANVARQRAASAAAEYQRTHRPITEKHAAHDRYAHGYGVTGAKVDAGRVDAI